MNTLHQLRWSLKLDYELLWIVQQLQLRAKLRLVAAKYYRYLLSCLSKGSSSLPPAVSVLGGIYHSSDRHGLASLQRVYCAHAHLREFVSPASVVVDVGANVGQFNFFARQYLLAARVVSIEPVMESYSLLCMNAADKHDCLCCAVSDNEGEILFHVNQESQLSSYLEAVGTTPRYSIKVPGRRLDAIASELGVDHVDLLKIDTEGSEYDVLKSAEHLLSRTDLVLVEMSVFRKSTGSFFELGRFLEARGFVLVELSAPGGRRPTDMDALFRRQ